ncbi:MAG TPA: TerB family tellurite resistance protein [Candidatus Thermoplasmatota archaeon]|nr:TerB family tellurite resistance protein [Candidatus Thermoplasmatota archaeon]
MDAKEAIVGILVAAMQADGRVLRTELQTATLHLEALEAVEVTAADVRSRADRLAKDLDSEGQDAFLDRCVLAMPKELRLPVLEAVVAVVAADAAIDDAEADFVRALARRLGVPVPARTR